MADRPTMPTLEDSISAPIPGQSALETQLVRMLDPSNPIPWPQGGLEGAAPLWAEVEHGRWLVRCPDCPSAQRAPFDDRRFYCVNLECPRPGGPYWRTVVWPDDWQAIEEQLLGRPELARNWRPYETAADLADENDAHAPELAQYARGERPERALLVPPGRVVPPRGQSVDAERPEGSA